jgi:hypothetical protein
MRMTSSNAPAPRCGGLLRYSAAPLRGWMDQSRIAGTKSRRCPGGGHRFFKKKDKVQPLRGWMTKSNRRDPAKRMSSAWTKSWRCGVFFYKKSDSTLIHPSAKRSSGPPGLCPPQRVAEDKVLAVRSGRLCHPHPRPRSGVVRCRCVFY